MVIFCKTMISKHYFLGAMFLLMTTGFNLYGQVSPSLFIVADYMKVPPEKLNEYLQVEQTIWKPLHRQRINQGIIVGWYLYAVNFAGTESEFNYVVLNLYDDQEHLESPWSADILAEVHPKLEAQDIMAQTIKCRENVRSELFYSIVVAPEIPLARPASYLQVNYMNVAPGNQSDYERLEKDIWQPVHNEMVSSGRTAGWGLWALLFPRGADLPYQYCTLNAFSDFSYVFDLDYSSSFSKTHPDLDPSEIASETQDSRTVVRTELWELIDYEIK